MPSLVQGAFWMSAGLCASVAAFLWAPDAARALTVYGAAAAGLARFSGSLILFHESGAPFPWRTLSGAATLPVLVSGLLLVSIDWQRQVRRASRETAENARLQAIRGPAEKRRVEKLAAERQKALAEEAERTRLGRIARAREQLQLSDHSETICDAATVVETAAATEAIPDLLEVLDRSTESTSVRHCAAIALIRLRITSEPIEFYKECIRVGTSERRMLATIGLGEVGSSSAEIALPLLREQMRSPHVNVRHAAVKALGNMGPLGAPLLAEAQRDGDSSVRELARGQLGKVTP